MTGGLGVNKDVWDGLSPDVQKVLMELGEEYTVAHAEEIMARYDSFLAQLPEVGATVTEMSAEDVATWKAGLPNLAADWVAANADKGAEEVMNAYFAALAEAGIEPKIDWSQR